MNRMVLLNDGETFEGILGCLVVDVSGDNVDDMEYNLRNLDFDQVADLGRQYGQSHSVFISTNGENWRERYVNLSLDRATGIAEGFIAGYLHAAPDYDVMAKVVASDGATVWQSHD